MAKQHSVPYRLYRRGKIWHAYISYINTEGERIQLRETTGRMDETEAAQYCIKRITELQKQSKQKASGEQQCLTVDEAFARYFTEKGQYLTLPKQRLSRLSKLKKELNVKNLEEITETQINNFIALNRNTLTNSTINRYLYLISAVLKTACEEWKVKTYPLKISKFKLKEPDENVKYLKDWETAQKIIDRAAPHLKPIIYTALYTGMRLGNILNLKWENIDFTNRVITIKVKDKNRIGGKNHSIPVIKKLCEILQEQPKINEYVFNFNGKPLKSINSSWRAIFYKRDVCKKFTHILKDPKLPYINFHTLRHTAATWILRKTNNLRITKEILGHSNINTTLKYAHVLDDEKRKALDSVFSE